MEGLAQLGHDLRRDALRPVLEEISPAKYYRLQPHMAEWDQAPPEVRAERRAWARHALQALAAGGIQIHG